MIELEASLDRRYAVVSPDTPALLGCYQFWRWKWRRVWGWPYPRITMLFVDMTVSLDRILGLLCVLILSLIHI